MRCLVLIGSFLACSNALDVGYGVPHAPVISVPTPVVNSLPLPAPAPIAPVPLQLVHNAPLIHSVPQPVLHSVPFPAPLAQAPAPLPFAAAPAPVPAPLPAPVQFAAPATLPLAAPVPVAPIVEPPSSQFHAQDEFGQFSFGYQNINSAKTETKDAFGVTRGSYQYVDANGVLQTVNYISDDINGFRVAGTNIPVAPEAVAVAGPVAPAAAPLVAPVAPAETPEVAAARAEHLAAHAEALANSVEKREAEPIDGDYELPLAPVLQLPVPIVNNAPAPVLNHLVQTIPAPFAAPVPTPNFLPVNQIFAPRQFAFVPAPAPQPILNQAAFAPAPLPLAAAPVPAHAPLSIAPTPIAAPLAAPVPVAPIVEPPSSQFHAQDEFGQFSFGYQNINSAKTETKDAFGVTRGSYQYVDANGVLQTVNYIADDINGFRVAGTNIPVAPEAALVAAPVAPVSAPLVAPVAPEETPEVAAARAEHLAAVEKAKADSTAV